MRRSIELNPHWGYLAERPGLKVWPLTANYPDDEAMDRSPYFQEIIRDGVGMRYAAPLLFWNVEHTSLELILGPHRTAQRPDFSLAELQVLETLHAHIETAYRRIHALQNAASARRSLENFIGASPLSAILLDWNLKPVFHNQSARAALAQWSGADPHLKPAPGLELPEDLRAEIEAMRAAWVQALRSEPGDVSFHERAVTNGRTPETRALLSMTTPRSPHFGKPSFLLRFETSGPTAPGRLAALQRLTPREREVALLIAEGASNQEIADQFGRNINTVKTELRSIFAKMQVPSRTRLMALLR